MPPTQVTAPLPPLRQLTTGSSGDLRTGWTTTSTFMTLTVTASASAFALSQSMTSSSTASTPWLVALRLQSNWGGSSDEDATSIQEDDVHYLGRFQFGTGWTSTSTPTTTVGVNLASAEDQVRDMVNRNPAQCGQAYIVDVLRRLQDRQRSLHHCLRLKLVAMEEVTTWFSTSVHSQPRIAAMFETASGTRLPDGSRKGILYASSSGCGCTGGSSVAGLS